MDVGRIPEPEGDSGGMEHVGRIVARAVLPATRLWSCASCGGRFPCPDLVEVHPEQAAHGHGVREGERYCRACAARAGVL